MSANVDTILEHERVPDPIIETPRLRLRSPRADDIDFIHRLHSSPEATKWTSKPNPHTTLAESEKSLDAMLAEHPPMVHQLVVELIPIKDGAEPLPVGSAGSFRPCELGYGLHPDYFGKGYATEAALAYCHWFRAHYPGAVMFGRTFPAHVGSVKVLEKCGFTPAVEGERSDWPLDEKGVGTWIDRTDA